MVTVQPLTKKRQISWWPLKIEDQFFPYPLPLSPARRGKGALFLWGFADGLRRLQNPLIFFPPSPTAFAPGHVDTFRTLSGKV